MKLVSIAQAASWASTYLHRNVDVSNISYLLQYGKVKKYRDNGSTQINIEDLKYYYESYVGKRELSWKKQLGNDLNWALSFDNMRETDTTKHVHRLHPYKGKFIPQLVEYFLDSHTDGFKKEVYFNEGDVILDPFCGSGTTLVQSNELGMHAVGIDISSFNALISDAKIREYDFTKVNKEIKRITEALKKFLLNSRIVEFENKLLCELSKFNNSYFPSPEYKYKVKRGQINEGVYAKEKEQKFLPFYRQLIQKYNIKLKQEKNNTFLDKWYLAHVRKEIDFVHDLITPIKNANTKKILMIMLSRTIRSCRATTHSDLATLKEPVVSTYYCHKHGKICKPIFSILGWWVRYSQDTVDRLRQFSKLRTDTYQICLTGNAKTIDIFSNVKQKKPSLYRLIQKQRINGIFSSPPYVGLINYHEQHAYAYDLFGLRRKDESEIGSLFKGKGKEARDSYVEGIAEVLNNCKKYLVKDYSVFLVANDKFNMYPTIAMKSGMKIVNEFKRPVLNRTERDKMPYSETIFHLKEK
ncbi:site-specific DNA-methyltransferase [bacterium]|nr:site-specific DNA-methyltransferase [bacterium]MBU3955343.1 site-specific DNA-methyltransferase [bacterium]